MEQISDKRSLYEEEISETKSVIWIEQNDQKKTRDCKEESCIIHDIDVQQMSDLHHEESLKDLLSNFETTDSKKKSQIERCINYNTIESPHHKFKELSHDETDIQLQTLLGQIDLKNAKLEKYKAEMSNLLKQSENSDSEFKKIWNENSTLHEKLSGVQKELDAYKKLYCPSLEEVDMFEALKESQMTHEMLEREVKMLKKQRDEAYEVEAAMMLPNDKENETVCYDTDMDSCIVLSVEEKRMKFLNLRKDYARLQQLYDADKLLYKNNVEVLMETISDLKNQIKTQNLEQRLNLDKVEEVVIKLQEQISEVESLDSIAEPVAVHIPRDENLSAGTHALRTLTNTPRKRNVLSKPVFIGATENYPLGSPLSQSKRRTNEQNTPESVYSVRKHWQENEDCKQQ